MEKSNQVWDYEACDGLSWLWQSILQVRREDQRSDPSTQIPRVEVFWNETLDRPLCLWQSVTLVVKGNKESSRRNCTKYGTTESTTVRHDHDVPSRGPSTQPRFDRFPVIRILVQLGFYFFINSSKNLVLEVRLWESRHHIIRLCVLVFDFCRFLQVIFGD